MKKIQVLNRLKLPISKITEANDERSLESPRKKIPALGDFLKRKISKTSSSSPSLASPASDGSKEDSVEEDVEQLSDRLSRKFMETSQTRSTFHLSHFSA